MTKAIIIEDEPAGLENLRMLLGTHCPDIEIIATGGSNADAKRILDDPNVRPNVAFLDISLPDGLIFQTLQELDDLDFSIIFVTAFEEYAVRAIRLAAVDYILKPIDVEELKTAVSRIRPQKVKLNVMREQLQTLQQQFQHPNTYDKIIISGIEGSHFVRLREIVRLEGEDNYTRIFMQNEQKFTASRTMKSFEELLEPFNFFRVHKKHLVNLNQIKSYRREDGGFLVLEDGSKIEVARRRRPEFFDAIRRLEGVVSEF